MFYLPKKNKQTGLFNIPTFKINTPPPRTETSRCPGEHRHLEEHLRLPGERGGRRWQPQAAQGHQTSTGEWPGAANSKKGKRSLAFFFEMLVWLMLVGLVLFFLSRGFLWFVSAFDWVCLSVCLKVFVLWQLQISLKWLWDALEGRELVVLQKRCTWCSFEVACLVEPQALQGKKKGASGEGLFLALVMGKATWEGQFLLFLLVVFWRCRPQNKLYWRITEALRRRTRISVISLLYAEVVQAEEKQANNYLCRWKREGCDPKRS